LAKDTLDAKLPPSAKVPVIMNPESICDAIVPVIGFHSSADQKFKNQSVFNLGDSVASKELTIIDDGLFECGLSSAPFDDEGNPQKRTPIIEKGILKSFICDQKYALMLNNKPTGNGIKPLGLLLNPLNKHLSSIVTSPTNFSISPGNESYESLIKDVKEGILIEQFSWLSPDPFSSGFSSEIRNGYVIKNGEIGQPIKGGMISGKVFDLIKNISGMSKSAEMESGATAFSIIAPHIKFDNVQVVGK
jgi:predicted Zn-dependent protease